MALSELKISDMIQVKAIAVITTRLPDGSSGFSMLIIITAQFDVGIQLGLGFTLNGIGGLIGINRAMETLRRFKEECTAGHWMVSGFRTTLWNTCRN